jgi:glycosyltransferase involved in cell wall biosynthesis
MLDYFASGVPVISTEFGARGLSVVADRHYLQAEREGFSSALRRLASMEPDDIDAMTAAARSHVEATLSWEAVAHELMQTLQPRDLSEPAPA